MIAPPADVLTASDTTYSRRSTKGPCFLVTSTPNTVKETDSCRFDESTCSRRTTFASGTRSLDVLDNRPLLGGRLHGVALRTTIVEWCDDGLNRTHDFTKECLQPLERHRASRAEADRRWRTPGR